MSYISGARSVADKQVRIASTKIDGIGPKKAIQDEPDDPNIIYEEPDDEASSSDKDVSDATLPARTTFSIKGKTGGQSKLGWGIEPAFGSAKAIARMFP
ncbi:hypothetical protein SLA2020_354040 [Shorea laevis]